MTLVYTLFPKNFNEKLKDSLILDLFPLEKSIEKELCRNEKFDFRILLNRNKVGQAILTFDFDNLDSSIEFKIRGLVQQRIPNIFTSPGIRSIHFAFFEKTNASVLKDLEKSVEISEEFGSGNLIKGKDLATFIPVEPRYSFDKIYMSEEQRKEVSRTLNVLKNHDLIYKTWGFEEVDPAARTILNFYGPPGTGKTMTAHAVAAELGIKILELNYAEIESKYVGDAAKNMVNAFNTAKEQNALLFFDEADSFLSRRSTSGTSSSEQAMNSQRSQMLMLLENFKGVVIFCTNLIKNYDQAFESRILKSIQFYLPDTESRIAILKKNLPPRIPYKNGVSLTDEEFIELSNIIDGFSGREIKNAVLKTLCAVAEKEVREFEFADFKFGFENAKKEFDEMKTARGGVDKTKLEKTISENLKSGNYVEEKAVPKEDA